MLLCVCVDTLGPLHVPVFVVALLVLFNALLYIFGRTPGPSHMFLCVLILLVHLQTGDMFLSAACIAYYCAFTRAYRRQLVSDWMLETTTH